MHLSCSFVLSKSKGLNLKHEKAVHFFFVTWLAFLWSLNFSGVRADCDSPGSHHIDPTETVIKSHNFN